MLNTRRRILRRGLPYGDFVRGRPILDEHGVVMLVGCTSLFRQFEFVQQQWINYGLDANVGNDTRPLTGNHSGGAHCLEGQVRDCIRSQIRRPPFVLEGIPQFVETRGGEYFLVPSMTALRMIGMGVVHPTQNWRRLEGIPMSFLTNFVASLVTRLRMLFDGLIAPFQIAPAILAASGDGLEAKAAAALKDPRVQRISLRSLRAFLPNLVLLQATRHGLSEYRKRRSSRVTRMSSSFCSRSAYFEVVYEPKDAGDHRRREFLPRHAGHRALRA